MDITISNQLGRSAADAPLPPGAVGPPGKWTDATRQQRSGEAPQPLRRENDWNHDPCTPPPPPNDRGKGSSALLLVLRCWIRFERFIWFKLVAGVGVVPFLVFRLNSRTISTSIASRRPALGPPPPCEVSSYGDFCSRLLTHTDGL